MAGFHADVLTKTSGRVKAARKLARRASRAETGLFLAEGPQAVREALRVPGVVREVFALASAYDAHHDLVELSGQTPWHLVDDAALASLTETVQPQGLVAVCRMLDVERPAVRDASMVAVCADVRDPGNAGTVIRCADAAGAGGVILTGSSVDPYNGKAVRATAGSLFHLPLVIERDPADTVRALQAEGFTVLAADGYGEIDLDEATDEGLLAGKTAWLFGNEAWGLPPELAQLADHRVRIPIHGRAESLNLATAASVCLYASAREQRAAATERERSDLVATVAHELRSPLTGVKGFVTTLLSRWDDLSDEQKKLMLETVHTDADRLSRLITELLDVARIDTGRLSLFRRPLDVAELAERTLGSVRAGTRRQIVFDPPADLPRIDGDPDKFIRVLTNLLDNAVRHGDGEITVSAHADGDAVIVSVDDQGDGIPPEVRDRVFTKFWTSGQGGSGLGMYIVNGLVTAHGGTVVIGEAPTGGARVTVSWPLSQL